MKCRDIRQQVSKTEPSPIATKHHHCAHYRVRFIHLTEPVVGLFITAVVEHLKNISLV